jgi:hypothetical protein
MATLTTFTAGTVISSADVNANFQSLNTENGRATLTLYSTAVSVGNTLTTEETLSSYTLPANTVVNPGDGIIVTGDGHCVGNANTKTLKLYLGTAPLTLNPTTTAPNNKDYAFDIRITWVLGTSWVWTGTMLFNSSGGVGATIELGGQITVQGVSPLIANLIKFTVTCPSAAVTDVATRTFRISLFKVVS